MVATNNSPLKGTGFSPASREVKRRLVCTISGLEKTGKTHQALTAPGPIYMHNFDIGHEGVVDRFLKEGKEVYMAEYPFDTKATQAEGWKAAWDNFRQDFTVAVRSPGVGSVVVDTETEDWELARLAHFGKLSQVLPHHYGPVNAEVKKLIRIAYEGSANVIFLRKLKPLYVNDKRTNEYEPSGFGDLAYAVQANLRVHRDKENGFHLVIKDCRQDMSLCGIDLEDEAANFETLLELVFPSD